MNYVNYDKSVWHSYSFLNLLIFLLTFYKIFLMYIEMSKDLSGKYYQDNKKDYKKSSRKISKPF